MINTVPRNVHEKEVHMSKYKKLQSSPSMRWTALKKLGILSLQEYEIPLVMVVYPNTIVSR